MILDIDNQDHYLSGSELESYLDKLWMIAIPSHEELTSMMNVRLWNRAATDWDVLGEDHGCHAGIEMCDDKHEWVNSLLNIRFHIYL